MENAVQGDFRDLRNKSDSLSALRFKTRLIGGFDPAEVEDYIRSVREDLQRAGASYKESLEEYALNLEMLTQEKVQLAQKLSDAEDKIRGHMSDNIGLKEENQFLKAQIEELERQIRSNELCRLDMERLEALKSENESLKSRFDKITESNSVFMSEKAILNEQTEAAIRGLETTENQNKELREMVAEFKALRRNTALQNNIRIFECSKRHQFNMERISCNINDISKTLEVLKGDMDELYGESKKAVSAQRLEDDE